MATDTETPRRRSTDNKEENFLEKLAGGVSTLAKAFKDYKDWNGEQLSNLNNRVKVLESRSSSGTQTTE